MPKNLVIVESPAKAKTIQDYLGHDWLVKSSYGHVRDLPSKHMSVDIEHDFEPEYEISNDKKKVVAELNKSIKPDTLVWLASDDDREGEAIAWHLAEVLKLSGPKLKRIVFHEITKPAILSAVDSPRGIDKKLVDAQQARRVLDRLVGYELSPLLWRKVRPGLSAGRVQSVAVRLIVEREREIGKFKAERNFKLSAQFATKDKKELTAQYDGTPDRAEAERLLKLAASDKFQVKAIDKTEGLRNPAPPFTTSSLQQEANRRLGFSVKQTMILAQKLYEAGAITYMRTDSLALSGQATAMAKSYIEKAYGADYHQFRTYSTKTKGAQQAHEAIRPTRPERETAGADAGQTKLYKLIRGRFLASQMKPVRLSRTKLSIAGQKIEFTANGEIIIFDGWLRAYPKSSLKDEILPDITAGDRLKLTGAQAQETLTRPPSRYSEAALVKALEDMGIGRPSTYAPTISTIIEREYVVKDAAPSQEVELTRLELDGQAVTETLETKTIGGESRKLMPTDTALVVTDFLVKHFPEVIDYDFTANVETEFDDIADGKRQWNAMIKEFYKDFTKLVKSAQSVTRKEASQARQLGNDPKTKAPILARYGRYGPMLQRGDGDQEDEKPDFAPLPPGATLDSVTLKQALTMFELPRTLGEVDGEPIKANIGRYGPYVQVGTTFASVPKEEDIFQINLSRAKQLIKQRRDSKAKQLIQHFDDGIEVKRGRYGPYVTDGKINAKVPKHTDPAKLTLEQVQQLLKKKAQA